MIKHFAKGYQCPSIRFTPFITHYVFQTYSISYNQMHVIVEFEYNVEKLRSVHLAKKNIKKKKKR